MPSVVAGFDYDIFISYRQKDNKHDHWVTEFVSQLKSDLDSIFKEEVSVYFDESPHDGLGDAHEVEVSLREKLNCLVFIPIISQTYCDPASFAWQNEFMAFKAIAEKDQFGLKVSLLNGNVASRILPVRIHEIDDVDRKALEKELGPLRSIDFIFKANGVNRPLVSNELHPQDNVNRLFYRDQVNKVANTVKMLITAMQNPARHRVAPPVLQHPLVTPPGRRSLSAGIIAIVVIACLFLGYWLWRPSLTTNDYSIAVLPFVNMTDDPNQEYFSDGMTDELLNRLFKIGDLRVISRTSSMKFKDTKFTSKEIGTQLGVAHIVEGGVQKFNNKIKLTVQLIDTHSDTHIWSETYEREITDLFAL